MWFVQIETLQAVLKDISLQMVHVRASQKQESHCLFVYAHSYDVENNIPPVDIFSDTSLIMQTKYVQTSLLKLSKFHLQ